jgi:hypothetical protein
MITSNYRAINYSTNPPILLAIERLEPFLHRIEVNRNQIVFP